MNTTKKTLAKIEKIDKEIQRCEDYLELYEIKRDVNKVTIDLTSMQIEESDIKINNMPATYPENMKNLLTKYTESSVFLLSAFPLTYGAGSIFYNLNNNQPKVVQVLEQTSSALLAVVGIATGFLPLLIASPIVFPGVAIKTVKDNFKVPQKAGMSDERDIQEYKRVLKLMRKQKILLNRKEKIDNRKSEIEIDLNDLEQRKNALQNSLKGDDVN